MLTATSPYVPAASRATRINSPCALCNAPIVGTSTRRFARGCVCASAIVVRIFTRPHQIATRAGIKNQSPRESGAVAPHSKTQARAKGGYENGHVLECGSALPLYGKSTRLEESKEQDKDAGDHQREHPHEIDVEPRVAQDRDAKVFVDHNRDQGRRQKISKGVDYDRRDEQRRRAKVRECPRVHLVGVVVMR